MTQTLFGIYFLLVNVIAVIACAANSKTYWLLPNLAIITFSVLYIIPLMGAPIESYVVWAIITCNVGLLLGLFLFRRGRARIAVQDNLVIRGNLVPYLGVFYCLVSLGATFFTLQSVGGLFAVINNAGGAAYLAARVDNAASGILGVLMWTGPLGVTILLATWLQNPKRYLVLFVFIILLTMLMAGYFLVTVRHNAVAMILMLSAAYFRFRTPNLVKALPIALALVVVMVSFQAVRVLSVEGLTTSRARETALSSFEHIEVTHSMMAQVTYKGFSYFSHSVDVLTFLVPRAFWPDKPSTSTLNRTYFPEQARIGSEKAPGIVAEGYVSAGYPGIFLLGMLIIVFLSKIQRALDSRANPLTASLLAATFIPYSYIGIRTGIFGKHLISFLVMFVQYAVAVWAIRESSTGGNGARRILGHRPRLPWRSRSLL